MVVLRDDRFLAVSAALVVSQSLMLLWKASLASTTALFGLQGDGRSETNQGSAQ